MTCVSPSDKNNWYLEQESFYGINIAILNFLDILLHEGILQKLQTGNLGSGRLQDKISGREDHDESGGTGE